MSVGQADSRKERIRARGLDLGFAAVGFTSAVDLDCADTLAFWLAAGRHGRMEYLATTLARRLRPADLLAGARTAIVCALPYSFPSVAHESWRTSLRGRIAGYAYGKDYHLRLAELLTALGEHVLREGGRRFLTHVDSGPLVEKHLARRAGLGWYGHNTQILLGGRGSGFLLGCLLTDLKLSPDGPFTEEHCGSCRACVSRCPTGALDTGPTIDARLCVSYLTIELRGPIPPSLRPALGNWVFGCDDCQTVCPWNEESGGDDGFLSPDLGTLLLQSEEEFRARYGGTAVERTARRGLARNAAVALGNSGNPEAVPVLDRALRTDPEPIVRAHAAWALGRIGRGAAAKALAAAASRRQIPPVAAEIEAAVVSLEKAGPA